MLLRLLNVFVHCSLAALGFRRLRRQIEDWSVVFYRLGRRGEPWVLLHGLGSNALSWAPVARRLARSCRLVVPELSQLGGTRGPRPALDMRRGPEIVAELMRRELAGEPATLVGMSLGGWLAVRLALAEPQLVSRLVLIDAAGYRDQDWEAIRTLVTVESPADVERLYGALFQRVPPVFRLSRAAFLRVFSSPVVTTLIGEGGLSEADLYGPEELTRLAMPVGLIWGEHDGLFSAATGRAMAAHLPHGRFYLVERVGHGLHWEAPARLLDALEACRRELPPSAPQPVARLGAKGAAAPHTRARRPP